MLLHRLIKIIKGKIMVKEIRIKLMGNRLAKIKFSINGQTDSGLNPLFNITEEFLLKNTA
jgi:hypothetical protein